MHTLRLFFDWPAGLVWSNVLAMPLCGLLAALFAFLARERIGRALKGWFARHLGHHAELAEIRARLDAHADLLDPDTPGGVGAVMSVAKDAKAAAEATQGAVQGLALVAGAGRDAATGKTAMRRTASGRFAPRDKDEG